MSDTTFSECGFPDCKYVGLNDSFITDNHSIMRCPQCDGNATQAISSHHVPKGCLLVGEDEHLPIRVPCTVG